MDEKTDSLLPPGPHPPGTYGSAREGTVDELVVIANEIWRKVRDSGVNANDDAKNDALYTQIREEYQQFALSFPIIVRWTVQAREYSEAAVRKYLKQVKQAGGFWKTREAYLESQAQYLAILYKESHPRASPRELSQYHEMILKQLKEEDKQFMKANEEAEKEVERQKKEVDQERRQRILAYLQQQQRQNRK